MRSVNVKIFKVLLIGVIVSIVLLVVIDRFTFSWTGLVRSEIGLCEYKSIGVPPFNGDNKKLSHSYNIPQIASTMSMNRNYEVNNHYNGAGLIISRMFKGVKYNIIFEDHNGVSEFNLNTFNFNGYPNGSVADGEKCTTPSHSVEANVYRMIDDLPLDGLQKTELKQSVRVNNMVRGKLF